jgi:SAM-dependent methyltransferase
MIRPFARHYDTIYADKDYDSDIAVLAALCESKGLAGSRVLEIGAGTGSHSVRVAPLVKELVSLEIDPDFAELARRKIAASDNSNVRLAAEPIERFADSRFDGAAAFFHVLNYIAPANRLAFIDALAARLLPGAWFITDIWNGDAVLRDPPRCEIRNKTQGATTVRQAITPTLDVTSGQVTLGYEIDIRHGASIERFSEDLKLYIWPSSELIGALRKAGFAKVEFWDYRQFPRHAKPDSWRMWMRAIRQ